MVIITVSQTKGCIFSTLQFFFLLTCAFVLCFVILSHCNMQWYIEDMRCHGFLTYLSAWMLLIMLLMMLQNAKKKKDFSPKFTAWIISLFSKSELLITKTSVYIVNFIINFLSNMLHVQIICVYNTGVVCKENSLVSLENFQ